MKPTRILLGLGLISGLIFPAAASLQNDPIMMEHWPPYYRPLVAYLWSHSTVRWVNITASPHTVRHEDCDSQKPCAFDSGSVGPGESFTLSGLPPGRYPYYCQLHPIMGGTLIVEDPEED